MRIYPASHYTMGGLWVDYELMTTIPGLYCAGEANFSDHGANRLGASALMQGLADGYFVLPYTLGNYLAPMLNKPIPGTDHPEFAAAESAARDRFDGYLPLGGTRSPDYFHRELGKIIWDYCGMDRNEPAWRRRCRRSPRCTRSSRQDLRVTGGGESVNQTLEKAGRVDDFFQLGMLMCRDALERRESCGGHFRSEYQTEEGEALRDDENFAHVAAWEWTGDPMDGQAPPGGARLRDRPLPDPELQVSVPGHAGRCGRSSAAPRRSHRRHDMTDATNLTLKIWRQDGPDAAGQLRDATTIDEISEEASFLELLDVLNERLIAEGKEAIVFDHDCREGICGTCSLMINGQAHGPQRGTATCQLHMRTFDDGAEIVVEPWRARAFPIIKDLMTDRGAFDRIVEVGGFITAPTGGAPDANLIPIPKPVADAGDGRRRSASAAGRAWRPARTVPPTCSRRPRSPTSTCCRRARPSASPAPRRWSRRWRSTSARARTTASARRRARSRSPSTSSP